MTSSGQRSRATSSASHSPVSRSRLSKASRTSSISTQDRALYSRASFASRQSRRASTISASSFAPYRGSLLFRVDKSGFKVPRYQNTYRLQPYNPYKCEEVDKILTGSMHALLDNVKYEPMKCMKICQDISADVREKIFKKDYDRYKYVVLISLIQKLGQHVQVDNGRFWDAERDSYSTCTVETTEFIAFGLVAATYYE